jgi:hypothetical protein
VNSLCAVAALTNIPEDQGEVLIGATPSEHLTYEVADAFVQLPRGLNEAMLSCHPAAQAPELGSFTRLIAKRTGVGRRQRRTTAAMTTGSEAAGQEGFADEMVQLPAEFCLLAGVSVSGREL